METPTGLVTMCCNSRRAAHHGLDNVKGRLWHGYGTSSRLECRCSIRRQNRRGANYAARRPHKDKPCGQAACRGRGVRRNAWLDSVPLHLDRASFWIVVLTPDSPKLLAKALAVEPLLLGIWRTRAHTMRSPPFAGADRRAQSIQGARGCRRLSAHDNRSAR